MDNSLFGHIPAVRLTTDAVPAVMASTWEWRCQPWWHPLGSESHVWIHPPCSEPTFWMPF